MAKIHKEREFQVTDPHEARETVCGNKSWDTVKGWEGVTCRHCLNMVWKQLPLEEEINEDNT